jgi:histidyl-tRNA synthetase
MKVPTGPYKGARDFYPEDKRQQQWLFSKWKKVVERYGYEEYDAPILEPTDLYLMKGSAEIVNEQTYTFKDRGDRSVTIRTEMTPSVSRMVAGRRQELAYPARWYSIPNLWRYERMQRGRLREFWQLNVDIFGVSSTNAELEMLQIVDDLFQEFRAKRSSYIIKVNSRVLVNTMFEFVCELNEEQSTQMIRLTDRMNKMNKTEFRSAVDKITRSMKKSDKIIKLLQTKKIEELPKELQSSPSVVELTSLLKNCKNVGIRNVEFDISLMRGFDYYTDIVFEAFDTDPENNRSILGGGRYDGLVAQFGVDPVPTVGFAVGDVVFMDFLNTHKLNIKTKPKTEVIIIIREDESTDGVQKVASELREMDVNVAVDYSAKKVDKQFKNALKTDVGYALFIGEDDIKNEQYILKDLVSGKEEKHSIQRIVSIVKDSRNNRQ